MEDKLKDIIERYRDKLPEKWLARGEYIWDSDEYFLIELSPNVYYNVGVISNGQYGMLGSMRSDEYGRFFIELLRAKGAKVYSRDEFLKLKHSRVEIQIDPSDQLKSFDRSYEKTKKDRLKNIWKSFLSLVGIK